MKLIKKNSKIIFNFSKKVSHRLAYQFVALKKIKLKKTKEIYKPHGNLFKIITN